jgi:superkiller protein 3
VLEAQPNDLDTQLNLAGALTEIGKTTEAVAHCEALLAGHPGQARLYFILAVALSGAKRDLDAVEAYEQALALEPEFIDAHVNLSALYADRGGLDAALAHSKTACALKPNDVYRHGQ